MFEPWFWKSALVLFVLFLVVAFLFLAVEKAARDDAWPGAW